MMVQVYAWGGNEAGQLGLGDVHNRRAPSIVDGLWAMPVHQLAAGDQHSAALTASGFLFTWGSNDKGQLGLPARAEQAVQVSSLAVIRGMHNQRLSCLHDLPDLCCAIRCIIAWYAILHGAHAVRAIIACMPCML